jgi:phosphoglycolate phosphatase
VTYLLVAWDVDHTLIENAGVSKRIYTAAYRTLTGADAVLPPQTEGRTDQAIMRLLFALHGRILPPWEAVDQALAEAGLQHGLELKRVGFVLPGAAEAIDRLHGEAGIVQTVLTGNIRANAHLKLATFGIDPWLDLDVGAYGSDATNRADLVPLIQERCGSKYGVRFNIFNTVIVGDTPRDVEAGRFGGARVVAVASGRYSAAQLHQAGASAVLPSLSDTELVLRAVTAAERDVLDSPRRP